MHKSAKYSIGVNTYGLIRRFRQDMEGTMQYLHECGFEELELVVFPVRKQWRVPAGVATEETFPSFYRNAHENGLTVRSVHIFCTIGSLFLPTKAVVRTIRKLKKDYGVEYFVFSGMFEDRKHAEKWATYLKRIVKQTNQDGCRIIYHNHSQEFEKVDVSSDAISALDYFFSITGDAIGLQLDIGWAGIVSNEIATATKYANYIQSIHLKDFSSGTRGVYKNQNMPKERFCAIGEGEIQTREVLSMIGLFPSFCGSIIIDQDFSTSDILMDLKTGYQNVQAMLHRGGFNG